VAAILGATSAAVNAAPQIQPIAKITIGDPHRQQLQSCLRSFI